MIKDCFEQVSNDPHGILFGMGEEAISTNEGKRMFLGKSNISDKTAMYPTTSRHKEIKDLYTCSNELQYFDKSKLEYVPPPVSKDFTQRHSFVHNAIKNKNKINLEHFYKIYNKKVLNKRKHEIIAKMHE